MVENFFWKMSQFDIESGTHYLEGILPKVIPSVSPNFKSQWSSVKPISKLDKRESVSFYNILYVIKGDLG